MNASPSPGVSTTPISGNSGGKLEHNGRGGMEMIAAATGQPAFSNEPFWICGIMIPPSNGIHNYYNDFTQDDINKMNLKNMPMCCRHNHNLMIGKWLDSCVGDRGEKFVCGRLDTHTKDGLIARCTAREIVDGDLTDLSMTHMARSGPKYDPKSARYKGEYAKILIEGSVVKIANRPGSKILFGASESQLKTLVETYICHARSMNNIRDLDSALRNSSAVKQLLSSSSADPKSRTITNNILENLLSVPPRVINWVHSTLSKNSSYFNNAASLSRQPGLQQLRYTYQRNHYQRKMEPTMQLQQNSDEGMRAPAPVATMGQGSAPLPVSGGQAPPQQMQVPQGLPATMDALNAQKQQQQAPPSPGVPQHQQQQQTPATGAAEGQFDPSIFNKIDLSQMSKEQQEKAFKEMSATISHLADKVKQTDAEREKEREMLEKSKYKEIENITSKVYESLSNNPDVDRAKQFTDAVANYLSNKPLEELNETGHMFTTLAENSVFNQRRAEQLDAQNRLLNEQINILNQKVSQPQQRDDNQEFHEKLFSSLGALRGIGSSLSRFEPYSVHKAEKQAAAIPSSNPVASQTGNNSSSSWNRNTTSYTSPAAAQIIVPPAPATANAPVPTTTTTNSNNMSYQPQQPNNGGGYQYSYMQAYQQRQQMQPQQQQIQMQQQPMMQQQPSYGLMQNSWGNQYYPTVPSQQQQQQQQQYHPHPGQQQQQMVNPPQQQQMQTNAQLPQQQPIDPNTVTFTAQMNSAHQHQQNSHQVSYHVPQKDTALGRYANENPVNYHNFQKEFGNQAPIGLLNDILSNTQKGYKNDANDYEMKWGAPRRGGN